MSFDTPVESKRTDPKEHDDGADVRVVDDLRAVGKAQRQHPTGVGPGLEKRRLAEGMQNTTKGSS